MDAESASQSGLSQRGARTFRPPLAYFRVSAELQQHQWSPADPSGNIIIAVAENKLSCGLVYDRLKQCAVPPSSVLQYPNNWTGSDGLRRALASLMERTFMKGIVVDPSHLIVMSGATAILDALFWCICEAGQGVLIPRPYYPAFDNDLTVKGDLKPVPFDLDEADSAGSIEQQLSLAAESASLQGSPIKALLLTNPHNPLSTMYKRGTLVAALRWCMAHEVHLVSDEIYALSVWGEDAPRFESLEKVAREVASEMPGGEDRVKQLLHVVFGLSKDFCASGLLMGFLHTRNATLKQAVNNVVYCSNAPGYTQCLVTEMLEDVTWMDGFLAENARRMREAYGLLSGALTEARIPFVPANSAMFCWVDLREGLRARCEGGAAPTWEDEDAFWEELAYKHGVLVTPGKLCHAQEPGFFRMCWAWVPAEALPVAVSRIRDAIDRK